MKLPGKLFILGGLIKGICIKKTKSQWDYVCRKCWLKGTFDFAKIARVIPQWEFTKCPIDRTRYFKVCPNCKFWHRKPTKKIHCDLCGKWF